MRIAMFTDAFSPRINGVVVSVESYSRQLAKQGHDVLVVCPRYIKTKKDEQFYFKGDTQPVDDDALPYKVFRVAGHRLIFSREDRLARLEKWFSVKKRLDNFKPDIIHLHSEFSIGYFGLTYAKFRKLPLFYTFHTLWDEYVYGYVPKYYGGIFFKMFSRQMIRFYLKNSRALIAPTKRIENIIRGYGIKTPVHLLPTGIPSQFLRVNANELDEYKNSFFAKYPELANKNILLFVGRVAKEKNLDFLLNVLENVLKIVPNTALLVVGGGPYLETLRRTAAHRNFTDSIVFTGYMDRDELPYLYSLSTIFTFASKTETQGIVTLESMLCKTPVVAIGEKGTVDVMQGDNGGFMVKDDLEVFTQRVIDLLTNPVLYAEKSAEAIEWGKSWTIETLTESLITLYQKALIDGIK